MLRSTRGGVGVLLLAAGAMLLWRAVSDEGRVALFGRAARGDVIFWSRSGYSKRATSYAVTVRFETAGGRTVEFTRPELLRETHAIGDRVPVRYLENDPSAAYIDTFAGLYWSAVFAAGLGGIVVAVAAVVLRSARRAAATARPLRLSAASAAGLGIGLIALSWFVFVAEPPSGVSRVGFERAEHDTSALLVSLERPPGARPPDGEPRFDDSYGGIPAQVRVVQSFEMPGDFTSTLAWYADSLGRQGWRLFDPGDSSRLSREWCRASYILRVQSGEWFGPSNAPTGHRVTLRLTWNSSYSPDRCPMPQ
jgi:uncharacterized protein DUF3592